MKYALVNNVKTEATKGARGVCPNCDSEVIAKCGERNVNHWAHKGTRNCDSWWEPETEWHRSWKNKFPPEWQEISLKDEPTNERHIADVRTIHDLVIEFQHSPIKPEERIARETFYQNMVWVVDGTRLKKDFRRFVNAKIHITDKPKIYGVKIEDECFPSEWVGRGVPVIFDFLGTQSVVDGDLKKPLYCLFPKQLGVVRIFAEISRKAFIQSVIKGEWTKRSRKLMNEIHKGDQDFRNQVAKKNEELKKVISEIATKRPKRARSTRRRNWRL